MARSKEPTGPYLDNLGLDISKDPNAGKGFLASETEFGYNPSHLGIYRHISGAEYASFQYYDSDQVETLGLYKLRWDNEWPVVTSTPFFICNAEDDGANALAYPLILLFYILIIF